MKKNYTFLLGIAFWILLVFVYIINFIHLINAILEQNITMIIIEAIEAFTAFVVLLLYGFNKIMQNI